MLQYLIPEINNMISKTVTIAKKDNNFAFYLNTLTLEISSYISLPSADNFELEQLDDEIVNWFPLPSELSIENFTEMCGEIKYKLVKLFKTETHTKSQEIVAKCLETHWDLLKPSASVLPPEEFFSDDFEWFDVNEQPCQKENAVSFRNQSEFIDVYTSDPELKNICSKFSSDILSEVFIVPDIYNYLFSLRETCILNTINLKALK
jgi:hypothetical protein